MAWNPFALTLQKIISVTIPSYVSSLYIYISDQGFIWLQRLNLVVLDWGTL